MKPIKMAFTELQFGCCACLYLLSSSSHVVNEVAMPAATTVPQDAVDNPRSQSAVQVALASPSRTQLQTTPSSTSADSQKRLTANPPSVQTPISGLLPVPYRLPLHSVRQSIQMALSQGERLACGQQTELLGAIYQDVTKYTFYPSHREWAAILDSLLAAYPLIRAEAVAVDDVRSLWRSRLTRYFQNARARHDNSLQIVAMRRHKSKAGDKSARGTSTAVVSGVVNHLPARPAGETDETIANMIKLMVDESHKVRPNRLQITELMDQTFADRRRMIVTEAADIRQLQERFPCLFHEDEMCAEFMRLTGVNVIDSLQDMLDRYAVSLVQLARESSKPRASLLASMFTSLEAAKTEERKRDLTWSTAVLCIPFLLGEKVDEIIKDQECFDHPVYVLHDNELCRLYVDGSSVCGTKGIEKCFCLLLATYYVFNLVICKHMLRTVVFLRKFVCHVDESSTDKYLNRAHAQCVALMDKLGLKRSRSEKKRKQRGQSRVDSGSQRGNATECGTERENEQVSETQGDNGQDCETDKGHEKEGEPKNGNRNDHRTQNSKGNVSETQGAREQTSRMEGCSGQELEKAVAVERSFKRVTRRKRKVNSEFHFY